MRQEIDYQLDEFNEIIHSPNFVKHYGEILGDRNKVVPAAYKPTFAKQPLIANKQFYYMKELPVSLITSDQLLPTLLVHFADKLHYH